MTYKRTTVVNQQNSKGLTALHLATMYKSLEVGNKNDFVSVFNRVRLLDFIITLVMYR